MDSGTIEPAGKRRNTGAGEALYSEPINLNGERNGLRTTWCVCYALSDSKV